MRIAAAESDSLLDPSILSVTESFGLLFLQEVRELEASVGDYLPKSKYPAGSRMSAMEATDYLNDIRIRLEDRAQSIADSYTPARWLWYTRRVSREFFQYNGLSTTGPSIHGLFEALTAQSRCIDHGVLGDDRIHYPTTREAVRPVAQIAALAVVLGRCHSWLRRAGKGTEFIVRTDDLPEPVEDVELESAITLFDERAAANPGASWAQGLVPLHDARAVNNQWALATVDMVTGMWPDVHAWHGSLSEKRFTRMKGQFYFSSSQLSGLRAVLASVAEETGQWWPRSLPSLVTLLLVFGREAILNSKHMGTTVPKVGYSMMHRNWLMTAIETALPVITPDLNALFSTQIPSTADEVIDDLRTITACLWPWMPGPVFREHGDHVTVDLYAATQRLRHMITMPRNLGGQLINGVATKFEEHVQEDIDRSLWAPSADVRELRGRDLRVNSRTITDADAIAAYGDTLLLIDCKNYPYTPEYDAGIHNVVRNVETKLNCDVEKWHRKIEQLRTHPTGDNYDFSAFTHIFGIVVTPRVLFSKSSLTNAFAHRQIHLRNASSLEELIEFVARVP